MKFSEFLNNFSSAMSKHKTAMQKLEDALKEVNDANDAIDTTISSFSDVDYYTEEIGMLSGSDLKNLGIDDYVDFVSLSKANPISEILNPVKGMAKLFKMDVF